MACPKTGKMHRPNFPNMVRKRYSGTTSLWSSDCLDCGRQFEFMVGKADTTEEVAQDRATERSEARKAKKKGWGGGKPK